MKNKKGKSHTYKIVGYSESKEGAASTMSTVRLTTPKLSSVKNTSSKKMTVKWKKVSSATGYQIQYSTSKTFSRANKKVTVKSASKVKKVISSLKKGKTYYVRIRSYKKDGNKTYYSGWSSSKSVKIKK